MKITKISYQKAFVVGPYLQEKIGVEIEVEDGDEEKAFKVALVTVGTWHRSANPHLYKEGNPSFHRMEDEPAFGRSGPSTPSQVIDYKEKENLEIAIDNATSLSQLEEIKDKCWGCGLSQQYIIKFNELNNGSSGEFAEGLG
jgi:hypothetical protein